LANVPEEDLEEELCATLENLGAKTMIIAHTPRLVKTATEMQRFGGRVWIVDTGISEAYGGPAAALIIENGYFNVWGLDHEDSTESNFSHSPLHRFGFGLSRPVPDAR
jgi:hypothetical protein